MSDLIQLINEKNGLQNDFIKYRDKLNETARVLIENRINELDKIINKLTKEEFSKTMRYYKQNARYEMKKSIV